MAINYLEKSLLLPAITKELQLQAAAARRTRISKSQFTYGANFHSFGKDYFDGGAAAAAYRAYNYDGRFFEGVQVIEDHCHLNESAKILELGCAKGYVLTEFFLRGYTNLVGVDLSEYAIQNAHHLVKDKLLCANALDFINNTSEKFDLIIIKEMLPHLREDEVKSLLLRLCDVTREDGTIYIEIQCSRNGSDSALIKKFDPTHETLMSKKQWQALLEGVESSSITHLVYLKDLV